MSWLVCIFPNERDLPFLCHSVTSWSTSESPVSSEYSVVLDEEILGDFSTLSDEGAKSSSEAE